MSFDIPVVLLLFKRKDTTIQIIDRIRHVGVTKIYLMSDEGRNDEEKLRVADCRRAVENEIDWPCTIIRNYAEENRGVFKNIGLGAKWVFEREENAIFLEDDNLPEITFFRFCEEMLIKYKNDMRVLWVCGTNYLGKYIPKNNASYMFTKHMLPCGWASWSYKFLQFYDGSVELLKDEYTRKRFIYEYSNKALYDVYATPLYKYRKNLDKGQLPFSWDYQMSLSVRANSLYGISPVNNQIKNIGIDNDSTHGGSSFNIAMTRRFCGMPSYPLDFPLKHPLTVLTDIEYEKQIEKVVTPPFLHRMRGKLGKSLKKLFKIDQETSLFQILHINKKT